MGKAECDIRIGTSGWYYDHWKETFYPPDLPKSRWLEHYAKHFDTVEINNTFYHLPKEQTLQRWCEIAPKGFLYAVKANRYITHIRKLNDASEPLERFFERVNLLKNTLGPILYQLPPSLHKNFGRLETFIKLLPRKPPPSLSSGTKAGTQTIPSICSTNSASAFASTTSRATNRPASSRVISSISAFTARAADTQATTPNPSCRTGPNGSKLRPKTPAPSTPTSTTTSAATPSRTQNS